jgi:hypothetical protein
VALLCTLQRATTPSVPLSLVGGALEGALRALWLHHPLGGGSEAESTGGKLLGGSEQEGLPEVPTNLGPNTQLYCQLAESVRALKAQLTRA